MGYVPCKIDTPCYEEAHAAIHTLVVGASQVVGRWALINAPLLSVLLYSYRTDTKSGFHC